MADDKLRALGEERVQDFLKLARVARLATSDHSGVPHNIPICFWFDEVAHFYFVIDEKVPMSLGTLNYAARQNGLPILVEALVSASPSA